MLETLTQWLDAASDYDAAVVAIVFAVAAVEAWAVMWVLGGAALGSMFLRYADRATIPALALACAAAFHAAAGVDYLRRLLQR